MQDTPLIVVQDAVELERVARKLAEEPVIGVDTESDSMHHYREKVCLIQISDRDADYIIDPLGDYSLEPLAPVMASREIVKIFHGADYDVVSLKRDFGFEIHNLFDTMISAQLLEMPRVGLADLCDHFFGAELDKQYQTHDWARRPLLPEHLDYARGDTHYLLAIREVFVRRLKRLKRLHIADEEFLLLEDREWSPRAPEGMEFLKIKGANKLDKGDLRILRALYDLRDKHAQRLDRPHYKVIPDQVLLKLSRAKPLSMDELQQHVRPKSSMVRRYGEEMVEAVKVGLEDERPIPKLPKKERTGTRSRHGSRESERLFAELKLWRKKVLKRDKVPMVMIASNAQLKALAGYRPQSYEELVHMEEIRHWQASLYGEELLALMRRFEADLHPKVALPGGDDEDEAPSRSRRRRRRRKKPAAQSDA